MRYVDSFILPLPKKNVQAYRRIARKLGKVWMEHGALEYSPGRAQWPRSTVSPASVST